MGTVINILIIICLVVFTCFMVMACVTSILIMLKLVIEEVFGGSWRS